MLEFQTLELEHIPLLQPFFPVRGARLCDATFGVVFLWRGFNRTQFAIENGALYLKMRIPGGGIAFSVLPKGEVLPGNGEPGLYEPLAAYCARENIPLIFVLVPAEELPAIQARFPGARAKSSRDWCDYLYLSEEMRFFRGKKWNGQRNHVNRFCRQYPDWRFEVLDASNLGEAERFFQEITEKYPKHNTMLAEEHDMTLELFHHYEAYRQVGGLLRVGETIVGLSIGEVAMDTLFVHIEKADREYSGVYPMLVNQFALAFAGEGVPYINREEDTGDPGLRSSKLSYHPAALLEKFMVHV